MERPMLGVSYPALPSNLIGNMLCFCDDIDVIPNYNSALRPENTVHFNENIKNVTPETDEKSEISL